MTLVVTVILGVGILFIASALDNTPLKDTFLKIINNQSIDWSGRSLGEEQVPPDGNDNGQRQHR
jgi:hypothetical protein